MWKAMNGWRWLLWWMKVAFTLMIWLWNNKALNGCEKAKDYRKEEQQSLNKTMDLANENHHECTVLHHKGSRTEKATRPYQKIEIALQCVASCCAWHNHVPCFKKKKKKMLKGYHTQPTVWMCSQWFLPCPHHKKGVEREPFSDWNGHSKGFRGDSQVYGKRRLPEHILKAATHLWYLAKTKSCTGLFCYLRTYTVDYRTILRPYYLMRTYDTMITSVIKWEV